MTINKRIISIMLVGILSLALFACGEKTNNLVVNFSDGVYIILADGERVDADNIECSYTDSVENVNEELKEVYDSIISAASKENKQVDIDYKYIAVQDNYIYKIKFNDNKEHGIVYHNNSYESYQEFKDCKLCVVKVKDLQEPTYETYDINNDTYLKIDGKAYIFYGRVEDE